MQKYREEMNLSESFQWTNIDETHLTKGISKNFTSRKSDTVTVATKGVKVTKNVVQ